MNFIVSIGGTGARVAEAFVDYSATGAVNLTEKVKIFVADKDLECGNTTRLQATVKNYTSMKENTGLPCMIPSFDLSGWNLDQFMSALIPVAAANVASYKNIVQNPADRTILDMFHSKAEQDQKLKDGFWGCANLGAAIIREIFSTDLFTKNNTLLDEIQASVDADPNGEVNIVLTGSIFGGTGASIFPAMAAMLREKFPKAKINGVLMLPYFRYGDGLASSPAAIGWQNYYNKTVTSLDYYARNHALVKTNNNAAMDNSGNLNYIFNSLNLIGSSKLENSCPDDTSGGPDQIHSFLLPDLYAAEAIRDCFGNPDPECAGGNPNIFGYSNGSTGETVVGTFPGTADIAKFTEIAFALRAYLYPQLHRSDIETQRLLYNPFGKVSPFSKKANVDVAKLRTLVDGTFPFCDSFLHFVRDIHKDPEDIGDVKIINKDGLESLCNIVYSTDGNVGVHAEDIRRNIENNPNAIRIGENLVHNTAPYFNAWENINAKNMSVEDGFKKIVNSFYEQV
ncbi:MAG: hypothetical protein IJ386_02730 [Clostridia bacterium]|nr:hypothetical protein [Clostridia bacterium]